MSTKFEQLLDYIVNEEMDKADELFHEIVVEKSRSIYENLIAEEEQSQEPSEAAPVESEMDESIEEEGKYEEEYTGMEEEFDLDEEPADDSTGDPADDLLDKTEFKSDDETADHDNLDASEEEAVRNEILDVIAQLKDTFAKMSGEEGMPGEEMPSDEMPSDEMPGKEMDMELDLDSDEKKTDEMMGFMENRRMTREYVEKVAAEKGPNAGANTGDAMPAPEATKSVVASGKGKVKPGDGAGTHNIVAKSETAAEDGVKPHGKASGLVKPAQDMKTGQGNVPGGKMGVKNLTKVAQGHGAEKKGGEPGPVGAGTGEKAGQTSIDPATKKQFLPGFK